MTEEEKISYYLKKSKAIRNNFEKKIRISILSSFTLNGIEEIFQVKCDEKNISCNACLGGYNQYNQEILDPHSQLYQFQPNLTFLILDTRSILDDLWHFPYSIDEKQRQNFIEKKFKEIQNLIIIFLKNSNSKLIISNFFIPTISNYGIFETKSNFGLQKMINTLNNNLQDYIHDLDSVYLFDMNGFISRHGENNVFDPKQFLFGTLKFHLILFHTLLMI